MPIGSYALTFNIAHEIWKKNPKSVLDLGVGLGMTGVLVRSYTADLGKAPWKTVLHGVEGFADYRTGIWDIYDHVFEGSIQSYLSEVPDKYDMIIMSDVIEHFEKEEGFAIAKELMTRLNPGGIVLIGTPGIFQEQGAAHGNEYERHRSSWKAFDFPEGYQILQDGSPDKVGNMMILVKYVKPR